MDVKTWKKSCRKYPDSISFTAVVDHRGRITIPSSVRKWLKISFSSKVLADIKTVERGETYEK